MKLINIPAKPIVSLSPIPIYYERTKALCALVLFNLRIRTGGECNYDSV